MNVERLEVIAAWLERGAPHADYGVHFNMRSGIIVDADDDANYCATACCIAGAAVQFFDKHWTEVEAAEIDEDDVCSYAPGYELAWAPIREHARDLLDISAKSASALFEPHRLSGGHDLDYYRDPKRVARVVRHFMATGQVDWSLYDKQEH